MMKKESEGSEYFVIKISINKNNNEVFSGVVEMSLCKKIGMKMLTCSCISSRQDGYIH